jgi:hypothetical protein
MIVGPDLITGREQGRAAVAYTQMKTSYIYADPAT